MASLQILNRLKGTAWKSAFFDRLKGRAAKLAFDRPKLWGRVGRAARLAKHHKAAFGGDYDHLRALFPITEAKLVKLGKVPAHFVSVNDGDFQGRVAACCRLCPRYTGCLRIPFAIKRARERHNRADLVAGAWVSV